MPSKSSQRGVSCNSGFGVIDNGVVTPTFIGNEYFTWIDTSTTGGSVPWWQAKIRNVQSATSSLSGSRKECILEPKYYSYTIRDVVTKIVTERYRFGTGNFVPTWPDPSIQSETKANNLALIRFVKRANAVNTAFQGSVAVGELAETLRMIRNPAMAFRKGLDRYLGDVKKRIRSFQPLKRKALSNAAKQRIIADTWLEHSFGWMPLIGDIRSGAEALARRRSELKRETNYVRSGGASETSVVSGINQKIFQYHVIWGQESTKSTVEIKYYGVVKREVYDDIAIDMKYFGFSPDTFLPTLWELIPYSFLVDYFANIGNIINGYAFNRSSLAWCNKGTRKQSIKTNNFWFDPQYAKDRTSYPKEWVTHLNEGHGKQVLTSTLVTRDKYTGSFVPTLEFSIPGMGLKWINMSALAASHSDVRRAIASLG